MNRILLLIFALSLFSCNKSKDNNIVVNVGLLSYNGETHEIPLGGFEIIIDTINNTITSNLNNIIGDNFMKSQLNDSLFVCYDSERRNIHYRIDSIEHKPMGGMLFYTSCGELDFLSGYIDSTYSIMINDKYILYNGKNEVRQLNLKLNKSKEKVQRALTDE